LSFRFVGATLVLGALAVASVGAGCSSSSDGAKTAAAAPCSTTTTGGHGGSSTGGAGGSTHAGGTASSGGASSSGGGGSGGTSAGGAAADGGPASLCAKDIGFWADGMSFAFPTAEPLALALGSLTYPPTSHPIAIVLLASKGAGSATIAIGATDTDGYDQVFPPGEKPVFGPATLGESEFSTAGPQAKGWLRVVDDDGPVDLALENISVSVVAKASCTEIAGTLDAKIPVETAAKTLHIGGVAHTIAELAAQPLSDAGVLPDAGLPEGALLHAIFVGETMSFDPAKL
jgi:hypothetical protein